MQLETNLLQTNYFKFGEQLLFFHCTCLEMEWAVKKLIF